MDLPLMQTLYSYHTHRFGEIWDSILVLDETQFFQEIPYSIGSLQRQMVHVMDDDVSWFSLLQDQKRPPPLRPEDFATRAAVHAKYAEIAAANLTYISSIDSQTLNREYVWHPDHLSEPQFLTGWEILLHVVNHGTDHRAQILRILHDLGAPSFDQDLMGYLVQTGRTATSRASR